MSQPYARIALFYAALYCTQGIITPYFPVWLRGQHVSVGAVSLLLTLTYFACVIANPLFSHLGDSTGRLRDLLRGLAVAIAVLYANYLLTHSIPVIVGTALLISLLIPAMFPLADRFAMQAQTELGSSFGRLRLWGSVGFAIGTLAAGRLLIPRFGTGAVVAMVAVAFTMVAALSMTLPDLRSRPHRATRPPLAEVVADRRFLAVLTAAALVQGSNGFLYSLSSIYWNDHGISTGVVSLFWLVGIVSEILAFYLGSKVVHGIRVETLLLIAIAGTVVRWLVLGSTTAVAAVLAAQVLQACTITVNVLALMTYVDRHIPTTLRASAIGLYPSLAMGILLPAGIFLGSRVYESTAVSGFYVMAALAACAAVPALLLRAGRSRAATPGSARIQPLSKG